MTVYESAFQLIQEANQHYSSNSYKIWQSVRGISLLQKNDISVYIIAVITDVILDELEKIYQI